MAVGLALECATGLTYDRETHKSEGPTLSPVEPSQPTAKELAVSALQYIHALTAVALIVGTHIGLAAVLLRGRS